MYRSWSINTLGVRIAKRDFEPGFFVEHFIKDMGIALEEGTYACTFLSPTWPRT